MSKTTSDNLVTACIVIGTAIALAGIIYASGAVTGDVRENKQDISCLQTDVKENTKLINNVNGKLDAIPRIESQLDSLSIYIRNGNTEPIKK